MRKGRRVVSESKSAARRGEPRSHEQALQECLAHDAAESREPQQLRGMRGEPQSHEHWFRSLLEASRDVIYRLNLQTGRFEYISPAAMDVVGFSAQELMDIDAEAASAMIHPEDLPAMRAALARLEETGRAEAQYRQRAKSGEYRWLSNWMALARDMAGRPLYRNGSIRDITERKRAEEVHQQNEERLRLAMQVAHMVSWEFDPATKRIWLSSSADQVLAPPAGTTVDRSDQVLSLVHADDVEKYRALATDTVASGGSYISVHRQVRDGEVFWLEERARAITDSSGTTVRLVGLTQNITERMRSEQALRESQAREKARADELTAVLDAMPAITFIAQDPECRNILTSRAGRELLRVREHLNVSMSAPEEERQTNFRFVKEGRELAPHELPVRIAASTGAQVRDSELSLVFTDGTVRDIAGNAVPLFGADGKVRGAVGSFLDVTERKLAEVALREAEERLHLALRAARLGVWDWNLETDDVLYSSRCKEMLGYDESEIDPHLSASAMKRLLHPDDRHRVFEMVEAVKRGERVYEIEFRLRHKDGHYVDVLSMGYAVRRKPDGPVVRIVGTYSDLGERKQAEERLKQLNESLEKRVEERTVECQRRAQQLRKLAARLMLAEQRERQRLSRVLHDELQQTLVAAKMRTELLKQGHPTARAEASQIYDLIDESIRASQTLSTELSPPVFQKMGLVHALHWLVDRVRIRYGLRVKLSCREPLPAVSEEIAILLFQSARELLFNIVKHAGTKVAYLKAAQVGNHLELTVSDKGKGFDASRSHTKTGIEWGGMGLFSIQERLGYVDGRMEIESAAGKGSRFRLITPPVAIGRPFEAAPAPTSKQPVAVVPVRMHVKATQARKIRILVADDHTLVRQGLTRLLQAEGDIEVVAEASDGKAAVRLARRTHPDVILMDVSMPRMNGVEATKIIHKEMPGTKVIGLSMYEKDGLAAAMRQAGAVDYLLKSGPPDALPKAIRSCITKRERAA